jgi:preprotein translocase subunit SecD
VSKKLVLLMASIAGCVLSAQTPSPVTPTCPTMEVSVVAEKSGDSARTIRSSDGRLVSLTDKPLLTIGDFTDANVSLTEAQIVLNVSMTADGAKRIQTFTAKNVGKQIAFLVNGRLLKMARILDPITGKSFMLSPFARDEAQKLADSINHKGSGCGVR